MNNLSSKEIVILGTIIAIELVENNNTDSLSNIKRILRQILTSLNALT